MELAEIVVIVCFVIIGIFIVWQLCFDLWWGSRNI